ncbi:Cytochrome P450 [Mycena chlorophos]|uniref:Cytochrome P450 n=1 Tax=Mycena chlorophos TaxID=658473 RepID=A0A8H6TT66_MYCCL|nr:Cytochrome P450 [Mycena chlorophos]
MRLNALQDSGQQTEHRRRAILKATESEAGLRHLTMIFQLILLALGARLAFELLHGVYNVFLHPLKNVPGPWYAAATDLYIGWHIFIFNQTPVIQQMMEKYGPIVRIAPNKVVFRDAESVKEVYLVRKFDKSEVYRNFKIDGLDHALTAVDNSVHTSIRRLSGPHYSAANVLKFQPEIHRVSENLLDALNTVGGKVSVDTLDLMKNFMLDIILFSNFGYRIKAMENWSPTETSQLGISVSDFPKFGIVRSFFPDAIWALVSRIPNKRWNQFTRCIPIISAFVTARILEVEHQMEEKKEFDVLPLVRRVIENNPPKSSPDDRSVVRTEGFSHMIAGTETSSNLLSYFFWFLAWNPEVMKKLQAEVDAAMPNKREIPELSVLQTLPYLNAFIYEGMRIYGTVPSFLERVVPSGAPFAPHGYTIPPGTIVGFQSYSMHRDPAIFPDPEAFNPDRWLDEADRERLLKNWMPFGHGPRMCAGYVLGHTVLRITVANVVRNFDITLDPATTKGSMRMMHGFAAFPAAGECKLFYTPRKDE